MRIQNLTAYLVRIPLKKEIRHASYARRYNDTVLIRCELEDGTVGWGEGLPRHYVTGETIETTWEQWQVSSLKDQLSIDWSDWSELFDLLKKFELTRPVTIEPPATSDRDCFGNSLRCAIEIAILDAATRYWNVPLSEVTAKFEPASSIHENRKEIRYGVAITSMSRRKQVLNSILYRLFGFQHVKVKVGAKGINDVELLSRVRRWMGQGVDLRIDANEAWNRDQLLHKAQELAPFQISSIEQPLPHTEIDQLAGLNRDCQLPIMLDESLCSPSDARRAADEQFCQLFNIRLSKGGGFLNCLEIAAIAHEAGIGYQLGCMVGETGILSAAGRHFACSVAGIKHLEGSYDRFLVRENLIKRDITFGWGGKAPELTGPGLGVEIDTDAINRLKLQEQNWT
ncbi:L-Ala-D/L-Glu epimerase [Polystyrenella longa]|uniref:Dipeptide epimerase n=1 Tax=Polystyrenella longa TaxID=2528007 RepID=A0A518CMB5_9PLAN|nr:dipeptide epimerase [Polystyrenella longa]QDU80365.1 L-Ala-D/L-Glu epimerase [Polystyrenella longa]